jgi:MFS family permease
MLVVSLSPFMGMLVGLFAGKLSDKVGRKPVMLASLLIQCASMLAFMAATSVWHYALISVFSGVGHALFYPAANAQVSDVVSEDKRPEVFALFHTALNLGAAAGPLLGLLLFNWNMHLVFFACAVTTGIYALLVWWKVPETLQAMPQASASAAGELASPGTLKSGPFSLSGWFKKHKLLVSITLSDDLQRPDGHSAADLDCPQNSQHGPAPGHGSSIHHVCVGGAGLRLCPLDRAAVRG